MVCLVVVMLVKLFAEWLDVDVVVYVGYIFLTNLKYLLILVILQF